MPIRNSLKLNENKHISQCLTLSNISITPRKLPTSSYGNINVLFWSVKLVCNCLHSRSRSHRQCHQLGPEVRSGTPVPQSQSGCTACGAHASQTFRARVPKEHSTQTLPNLVQKVSNIRKRRKNGFRTISFSMTSKLFDIAYFWQVCCVPLYGWSHGSGYADC